MTDTGLGLLRSEPSGLSEFLSMPGGEVVGVGARPDGHAFPIVIANSLTDKQRVTGAISRHIV